MAAMTSSDRHDDSLLAFCKRFDVQPALATQSATVPVELLPYIPDAPPPGGGSGSGSGS